MRNPKLLVSLLLIAALAAAGCGGGGGGGGGEGGGGGGDSVRAAIVTDVGGLGDQSFNDSANAGLERAGKELGAETRVLESGSPTDYVNNLTQLADNGFSPIFGVGFLMTDAVSEVASQYPDANFAIVDSVVEADNVASLTFREGEGGYLAGVVAGLMTQEDTEYTTSDKKVVGFLGGQEGAPPVQRFQAGYEAGVEAVCPDCEVVSQYVGATPDAFNDPARGREIALRQIDGARTSSSTARAPRARASSRRPPTRRSSPSGWTSTRPGSSRTPRSSRAPSSGWTMRSFRRSSRPRTASSPAVRSSSSG